MQARYGILFFPFWKYIIYEERNSVTDYFQSSTGAIPAVCLLNALAPER